MGCISDKAKSTVKIQNNNLEEVQQKQRSNSVEQDEEEAALKLLYMSQSFHQYKIQNNQKYKSQNSQSELEKQKILNSKSLINPENNQTIQNALMKIKHKKGQSKGSTVMRTQKKRILEIMEIDDQGQIKIDNDNQILAALQRQTLGKRRYKGKTATIRLIQQLQQAKFTINRNRLQVVVEECTEEDGRSDHEEYNESDKFENSTVYSANTASHYSLDQQEAKCLLQAALQMQVQKVSQGSLNDDEKLQYNTINLLNKGSSLHLKRDPLFNNDFSIQSDLRGFEPKKQISLTPNNS
ncbi:UNKNOWN [Stylonychia lemnae]|uniref:Uncharacterized protein n=1 Tax=Stylonychia lemnae TaxID=5949 RepID=A0A078AXF6_STYLE|nr:UNKNOWN [Stylonychia lemnae]|eukprot:CDW85907.1 UNKNOWN [Stylonychia lemnae]